MKHNTISTKVGRTSVLARTTSLVNTLLVSIILLVYLPAVIVALWGAQ